MENLLMNKGFMPSENPNEYVRGDWTVRLDANIIEVFNNPDKARGIYYISSIHKADLQQILEEIEEFDWSE